MPLKKYQSAGPSVQDPRLLGASIQSTTGSGSPNKVFQDTVTFPTHFMIKVVGENTPSFAEETVNAVLSCLGPQATTVTHTTKEASGGKYVSVSIKPYFQSAEELYAVYDRVKLDKRVKFML